MTQESYEITLANNRSILGIIAAKDARIAELEAENAALRAANEWQPLSDAICADLRKRPEMTRIFVGGATFNGNDLANEIEAKSEIGTRIIADSIMLAIDLFSRGKRQRPSLEYPA